MGDQRGISTFFNKTKQLWPGRSHVREQAKGSIFFGLFVGAVGWSTLLLLWNRSG